MLVRSPNTASSFSFGIVISESTNLDNCAIPASATSVRFSKRNGFVTTANGQYLEFTGNLGNDRGRTCSGSTTHAGGDEHHVGTGKHFRDPVAILERSLTADLRVRSGAQSFRERAADLQRGLRVEALQCLRIGISRDEIPRLRCLC
jgi:hypothetical protein